MPSYEPPLKDYRFILHEVLAVQDQSEIEGYADLTADFTGAVLTEAGKIAAEVLAPLNLTGDAQGCRLENGVVRTPDGFADAYALLCKGGWPTMGCDPEFGGQGVPVLLNICVATMHSAANMAFMMYPGLTHAAYSAIHAHGSEDQKAAYLPKLVTGEWAGTMNLTEAHCGTDLGLLRTSAEPQDDGSYRITGTKIFISAGEHDLATNIIHLVLARIPGGPDGIKGVSLFVVPKFLVKDDGALGTRNRVACSMIEEKMGIHANATCTMEYDGATGWLVGAEHKGLRAMFTMMNEARLGVGMQGLAVASAAYQEAVAYARERLQGRAVTGTENPDGPADPLIVHPDVRRMLLDQKSFVEGARAWVSWIAMLVDTQMRHSDPATREQAGEMVALVTPVIKGFMAEESFRLCSLGQQVFGGAGYIEESGMSQFVRDARITMIYEGATGVQALDLVGRKLPRKMGQPIMAFFDLIASYIEANGDDPELAKQFMEPLGKACADLRAAAMYFMEVGMKNPNAALAGSVDFLHLFGHVCMGLSWAKMAKAASVALRDGTDDPDYYNAKLTTGRYYMSRVLPETALRLTRIKTGAEPVMDLPAEAF